MAAHGYTEPVAWHASLPGVVTTAAALIGDGGGKILLVKPNYRDFWGLPGGICEFREPPHAGCAREVAEELGLVRPVGALLSLDWQVPQAAYGSASRPVVYFIFDGGTLLTLEDVRLQADELEDCRFADADEMAGLLPPHGLHRVRAAPRSGCAVCARLRLSPLRAAVGRRRPADGRLAGSEWPRQGP